MSDGNWRVLAEKAGDQPRLTDVRITLDRGELALVIEALEHYAAHLEGDVMLAGPDDLLDAQRETLNTLRKRAMGAFRAPGHK